MHSKEDPEQPNKEIKLFKNKTSLPPEAKDLPSERRVSVKSPTSCRILTIFHSPLSLLLGGGTVSERRFDSDQQVASVSTTGCLSDLGTGVTSLSWEELLEWPPLYLGSNVTN